MIAEEVRTLLRFGHRRGFSCEASLLATLVIRRRRVKRSRASSLPTSDLQPAEQTAEFGFGVLVILIDRELERFF